MRIEKVSIKNYMGLEDIEIQPGALTIVSGRNGSGKTSIVQALQSVLGSGHDPSVIRLGADAAVVEIEISDGTTIKMRVTEKTTTRTITDKQGRKITRSAEYINSIVSSLSLDPIAFLSMAPKAQLTAVLQAVPLRVTAQDLSFVPVKALAGVNLDRHALEVLGDAKHGITGSLYQERTEINRLAKDKRATAKRMRETLPKEASDGSDWDGVLSQATADFRALQAETRESVVSTERGAMLAVDRAKELCHTKATEIREELAQEIQRRRVILEAAISQMRLEFDDAVDRLRAQSDSGIADREKERNILLAEIEASKKAALAAIDADYQPKYKALTEKMAQAKAMVETRAGIEKTREFIASEEAEAGKLEIQSEALTKAISGIEALKQRIGSQLPVPGLEVTEGGLTLDGVPFQRVNKAKQIQVALSIAKLQALDLGLILIDDAEHMDAASFAAFKEAALASGLQFVASVVENHELEVKNA